MKRLPPPLLALTPGDLRDGPGLDDLLTRVGRALEAGLRGVLLREPLLEDGAFLRLARALRSLLGAVDDSWLGVHDRGHVARLVRADGLHGGWRSLTPNAARRVVGPDTALGLSTHRGDDLAAEAEVDYLFHGPVHPTPSKHGLLEAIGLDGVRVAAASAPRPVWALGGLEPEHLSGVLDAGARGAAVRGGILAAEDPATATRAYLAELEAR